MRLPVLFAAACLLTVPAHADQTALATVSLTLDELSRIVAAQVAVARAQDAAQAASGAAAKVQAAFAPPKPAVPSPPPPPAVGTPDLAPPAK